VKPMTDSSYLRDKAEQALRLARDITDQALVKSLIEAAAESLGRADAIDLVEGLKDVAAALGEDPSRQPRRQLPIRSKVTFDKCLDGRWGSSWTV
jgi:hypothetical protein